jgi:hypothetical protein
LTAAIERVIQPDSRRIQVEYRALVYSAIIVVENERGGSGSEDG